MAAIADRLLLTNVPKVEFYSGGLRCPEDIPFPSVMRALVEYFKDDELGCKFNCNSCMLNQQKYKIRCTYSFFIGVSGVASFLNWKPGWADDNVEIMYMSDDPEAPFRLAFEAIGYTYKRLGADSEVDVCRKAIVESINKGRPVIGFGPVGPPEASLLTGYDEQGQILIGWNFFQNIPGFNEGLEFEPTGEYRQRNWLAYEPGFSCLIIEEQKSKPPLKDVIKKALAWMVQVARTPVTFGDRANGLAAYHAWASQLLQDAVFPADDNLRRQRYDTHNNVTGFLAEARWYGAQFLIGLTDHADTLIHRNAIEDLLHAAALYAGEHHLMWQLWDLVGGIGNPQAWEIFAEQQTRAQMVPIISQARQKDGEAIQHIESALKSMG